VQVLNIWSDRIPFRKVTSLRKNAKAFPEWSSQVATDVLKESDLFLENALLKGDGKLGTLLTSDLVFPTKATALLYGVTVTSSGQARAMAPAGTRMGLLTLPAVLAVHAREDESDVVARGRFVREDVLCQKIPDPPPDVNAVPPKPDGARTQRERLAAHSTDPTCAVCHALLDPIGFGFETLDGIGRTRATELGRPVDASGRVVGLAGPSGSGDGSFKDLGELARLLAGSREAHRCAARAIFEVAHGRSDEDADRCAIDALTARLVASGGSLPDALVGVVGADEFVQRQRQQ
jgi:hypothetical protein